MENFYCPYCGLERDTTVAASVEHVVPYALGGSDELTITTCAPCNNDLGSKVDAPFLDFFPVRSARFFIGLDSGKGNGPTLDLSGTGWIDGREVRVSHLISSHRNDLRIADPTITKTANPDRSERWEIFGDPAMVRNIVEGKVEGKLRKQNKLGKTLTTPDGVVLTPENLESICAGKEAVTPNPSVLMTILPDYLTFVRFFSKLALAMGQLHFGETFSRSATGASLRRQMTAERLRDLTLRGRYWPETHSVKHIVSRFAETDCHVIAIVDTEPPVLVVSLFGEYDALLPLGELTEGANTNAGRQGTVWRIEMPSRRLSRLTLGDFVAERCRTARR